MNDPDARFAIIEIPPGPGPPEAIVVGNMDAVMRCLPQTVASEEQEQRLARAEKQAVETERQQQETRICAAKMLADRVEHLATRMDKYEARKQEFADQQQREAEAAEAARIEAMLDALPDPDDHHTDDGEFLSPVYRDPTSIGGPLPKWQQ
jgi:hypothetical protein